jgi:osmoprotectant transport system substrate-binding protein
MHTSRRLAGTLLVVLALIVSGCTGGQPAALDRPPNANVVTIASFAFPESTTVAELYAQAAEGAGLRVQRAFGLASREVVEPALEQGKVDVVPEYLGTALSFVEPGTTEEGTGTDDLRLRASAAYGRRGISVLGPSAAQNQNGIAVLADTAERLHLTTISDLVPLAPHLVFGGPPECPERPFCLRGLARVYGLTFKSFTPLDAGGPLSTGALETRTVDVALLFTSSGTLADGRFRLLRDDRGLQPAENVVPMVRNDALLRFSPALGTRLDRVSAALTTADLVTLNHRVEVEHASSAQAAREWLRSRGLA